MNHTVCLIMFEVLPCVSYPLRLLMSGKVLNPSGRNSATFNTTELRNEERRNQKNIWLAST